MAEVVRTKRTVVKMTPKDGSYAAVGSPAVADVIVPIYDAFNPYQTEIETNPMNRARGTLDPENFWVGIATSRLQGNFYVYGIGDSVESYGGATIDSMAKAFALLPPWAQCFLPAAGFTPSLVTPAMQTSDEQFLAFNPVSDSFYQVDFTTWLNSYKHVGTKARGNLTFSAEASNPVNVAFDFMGKFDEDDAVWEANPDDSGSDPGIPPRMCGTDTIRLRAQGKGTMFLPKLMSVNLNLGRAPEQRRHANVDGCLEEITFLGEAAPRLQIVVEVENLSTTLNGTGYANVKEFIRSCYEGQKYAFEWNIGPYGATNRGKRFQFRNYHDTTTDEPGLTNTEIEAATDFRAQMIRAPQYVDVNGKRCLDLEFQLGGDNNNFLQIVAM